MSKAKNIGVVAAMAAAVVCTHSAMALDIPGAGGTWIIPANTTNEVTEADMAAYNALEFVEFTDETSALRFTSDTPPNVKLKGAGWMIKDSDASWTNTCAQTDAWYGTWDVRRGTILPKGSGHGLFYYYGTKGLYNLYIREGAEVTMDGVDGRGTHMNTRIHLQGQLTLAGNGGNAAQLCQIEVEGKGAKIYLSGTTLMYFYKNTYGSITYQPRINLNGHYLNIYTGGNYSGSILLFCNEGRGDLKGPGAISMDSRTGGIRVYNYNTANYFDGMLNISDGLVVTAGLHIATLKSFGAEGATATGFGVLRQKDSKFVLNRAGFFGSNKGGRPAYLLESGIFDTQQYDLVVNGGNDPDKSAYLHVRQTGGDFSANKLTITNNAAGLNADFAFGGSGTAKIKSNGLHINGDATFSFNDDVKFSVAGGIGNLGGHHIWAYNGGTAESRFLTTGGFSSPDGDFFALNGGSIAYGHTSAGTASDLFGSNPEIRVYERGGGIAVNSPTTVNITGIDILAPKGNVLKSIGTSAALTSTTFRTPPSVEITDTAGGSGTNAAAVVDFDFDTKTVKGITIVSRGENYTAPTANLRFRRGEALLSTPLTCTVGPEEEGEFTFSSTNLGACVNYKGGTNYLHGSLVIDMDQLGLIDGSNRTDGAALTANSVVLYFKNNDIPHPYFPNLTNIIIKSGALLNSSSYGYKHNTKFSFLSSCYSIEMYGGHLGGGSVVLTNFVIGGTAWLTGHQMNRAVNSVTGESSPYWADVQITSKYIADGTASGGDLHANWRTTSVPNQPGTMIVDVDATPDGEPSKLLGGTGTYTYSGYSYHYGTLRFGGTAENPSTLTIKNYESLRKTKGRRTLLDLSANSINVFGTNNVNAVTPPDIAAYGQIKWSPVQRKLYWVPAGGMYLIFK